MKLTGRNSTCTVFGIVGHCRPVSSPAEGRQYHRMASRGRDDMHFESLVLGSEGAVAGRFLDSITSQENVQVIHTALQSRHCRDLRVAGSSGARDSLLSTEKKCTH